ncbi:MAG TPA: YdcF family protein [Candidatus Woesebacteria bacterium]|nr:YdcF family protein [Candidatus Woesebacteria bacterium]
MKFDVILILASGINNDGTLPQSVLDHITTAKKLYDKNYASRIIMSGCWSSYWDHCPPQKTEAQLMYDYAVSLGIPKGKILKEEHSQNTYENLYFSNKLFLEPYNWKKIIIITTDFHMQRVIKTAYSLLGSDYTIKFIETKVKATALKRLKRYIKEIVLLYTHRFFQYFTYSR